MKFFVLFLICLQFFHSGCQVGPKYHPPQIEVTNQWKNEPKKPIEIPQVENWWDVFKDPMLSSLIKQAIQNNPTLAAATQRVEQARDYAKIVKSELFPQINLTPAYSNSGYLEKYPFGPNSHHSFITRRHQVEYFLPLSLHWELDIWGKIRSKYDAAKLSAEAQAEAYNNTLLILTTDLASAYFQLRTQDAIIDLYRLIRDTRKKVLDINESRYVVKIINYTDVTLAKQDLNNTNSEFQDAMRLREVFENQIAVLLGISPSEFRLDHLPIQELPPVIPAGIASDVLLRRPDLREQEREMAAMNALIGSAYASYFPSVELTSGLGVLSPVAKDFFKSNSRFWAIGTNISQFIFDAGARYYNVQLTWAQFKEAIENYKQKVLVAFQEVEDALSNIEWFSKEMESVQSSIEADKVATNISLDRYKFGVSYFLNVANDEKREFEDQVNYFTLLGQKYLNTIHLIKAIGGGWSEQKKHE